MAEGREISFDEWREAMERAAEAFDKDDAWEEERVREKVGLPASNIPSLIVRFNESAATLVERLGDERFGGLLWYVIGIEQLWSQLAEGPYDEFEKEEAIHSLRRLYADVLDPRLASAAAAAPRLRSACAILWDVSGGLSRMAGRREPARVADACLEMLDFALGLNETCRDGALFGLMELRSSENRERADEVVRRYCRRAGRSE